MQTKTELRKHFLALRRAIAPADRARWNASIQERTVALPELQGRDSVYIYIAAQNEVETRGLIQALLGQQRSVLAPMGLEPGVMDWGRIDSLDGLRRGRFGFLEPSAVTRRAEDAHHGVAIVPCVAYTARGDRLGRGGGYYDRFLSTFSGTIVALAFECQRAQALPVEAHDIKVNCVVTEIDRIHRIFQDGQD